MNDTQTNNSSITKKSEIKPTNFLPGTFPEENQHSDIIDKYESNNAPMSIFGILEELSKDETSALTMEDNEGRGTFKLVSTPSYSSDFKERYDNAQKRLFRASSLVRRLDRVPLEWGIEDTATLQKISRGEGGEGNFWHGKMNVEEKVVVKKELKGVNGGIEYGRVSNGDEKVDLGDKATKEGAEEINKNGAEEVKNGAQKKSSESLPIFMSFQESRVNLELEIKPGSTTPLYEEGVESIQYSTYKEGMESTQYSTYKGKGKGKETITHKELMMEQGVTLEAPESFRRAVLPVFERGIGPAPGEEGYITKTGKKTKAYNIASLFRRNKTAAITLANSIGSTSPSVASGSNLDASRLDIRIIYISQKSQISQLRLQLRKTRTEIRNLEESTEKIELEMRTKGIDIPAKGDWTKS